MRFFLLATAVLAIFAGPLRSQKGETAAPVATAGQVARLPVTVIGDKLVLRCELSTPARRIPANLFIEYDRACGLELHNQAAGSGGLKVDQGGHLITVYLPGFNIQIARREHPDQKALDDFSKLYSKELGETACIGTIGLDILRDYHITFDLAAGLIYLRLAREKVDGPPEEVEGATTSSISLVNDLAWMPVRLEDNSTAVLALGSSRIDSVIDQDICGELNRPAGNIGKVALRGADLSADVAWRPSELIQVHPDRPLGVTGLGFLMRYRVEVDRVNLFARLTRTSPAVFPKADLAYFKAMVTEEATPLLKALDTYPSSRLAREAAEQLMLLTIDDKSTSDQDIERMLQWMDKTRIEDLRATEALKTMQMLLTGRRPKLAIRAGRMGIKQGRKDRYVESVHKLHAKVGELLLEDGEGRAAWEHLLSAAFGLPNDGIIKLHLGRFYEQEKRYRRAFSSYIMAVIQPESGPQAVVALEGLQLKMKGEPLSVDLVDRMVQGKTYNFSAATKFKATDKNSSNRCVLVEHFINAHLGRKRGETWMSLTEGGTMASEGILSHFDRQTVAVITYHLPQPEPSALQNAASLQAQKYYGIGGPGVFLINGKDQSRGAGRWRDAEALYEAAKKTVYQHLKEPSKYEMSLEGKLEGEKLTGRITVTGPSRENTVLQVVLVERGVLYPGKGKVVVHRMVARDELTPELGGIDFEPKMGVMVFDFERKLADVSEDNSVFLEDFEEEGGGACSRLSMKIDPRQVAVVAFVRDSTTSEVLQAIQVDIKPMPKSEKK
ncbi:MAG: hypothetical protein V3W41_08945 [Planctomycetota bacterium]